MRVLEADYVIVGAGTAGCVLANRLSEDPKCHVILLEAGGKDRHPFIHVPAGFMHLLNHPRITWGYRTAPEPETDNRLLPFPRGRGLGGSSAINGLLHVRPFPEDIDDWDSQGATGWNFENCLPYFRRSESWRDGSDPVRGTDGPICVATIGETAEICAKIVESGVEAGLDFVGDANANTRNSTIWYYQQARDGRYRSSAARSYLRPARTRSNLRIVTQAEVSSIRLENGQATGVSVALNGQPAEVRARKEVLLCAGVIGSPRLLELSGIGDPAVLDNAKIPVKVKLAEVGRNLQDHYIARISFRIRNAGTSNERSHGIALAREVARYVLSGQGLLTSSAAAVGAYANTSLSPQRADVQYIFAAASFQRGTLGKLETEPGVSCGAWQMRPESRGETHIQGRSLDAAPVIAPGFLTSELDRRTLIEALKFGREIFSQPSLAPYVVEETFPGNQAGEDVDAQLLRHIREHGATVYHGAGTCRMGSDTSSVVDSELRVRGVGRLRVIDASVMPVITSTNTNATVAMIAERASDLIKVEVAGEAIH